MTPASAGRSGQTRTVCPYCGVGCGLVAETEAGRLVSVAGDRSHPVNHGRTCAKPLALPEASRSDDRATVPMRRRRPDGRWSEWSWDEAIPELAERLLSIRAEHGPGSIAFYISGQLLTEDYYVVNKLAKGFIGTNNVDSNSRLCMSSAVAGYDGAFGSDGPPPAYGDIAEASCFFLLGTNTAACHPIIWSRIRDRQSEGATVIVADPRLTETARAADLHLPVRPGTDLPLLNAMLHVIDRENLTDRGFIRRSTEGYEAMAAVAAEWPPERAAEVCGVPVERIVDAARRFAIARGAMALWSMGANQSTVGTLKNRALNNLCLATGQIGRPGAGPLSLTGQPNAMGGRETGGLAHLLPGYRKIASEADRAEVEAHWDLPPSAAGIAPEPGLVATDLFEALEDGRVRAVWICATNPAVSMPDAARARDALRRAELVVCQDAYHPTETSALADVVLPAAQWPEKEGTMTNSERRVSLVRKASQAPGEALPDWEIFARLGRAMGWEDEFAWSEPAEVYDEFVALTTGRVCDMSGISHERLRQEGSLQWPCPATRSGFPPHTHQNPDRGGRGGGQHPGTARLYADHRYPTPSGRARFAPTPHAEPAEVPDPDHPLILTTGRVANQWHTMTRTGKSKTLVAAEPEPFVELAPVDGARAGIADGDQAEIVSRRGSAVMRARLIEGLPEGVAFAPFHWGALHGAPGAGTLNEVTSSATDPTSRQPELKACAVRVERVTAKSRRNRVVPEQRLVVVGTGMAGLATVEAALERSDPGNWQVTMIGAEAELPYNRILLSKMLADSCRGSAELHPKAWYEACGVEVKDGVQVESIDTAGREIRTGSGQAIPYDALVLATGSRPHLPPIPGLERDGVLTFRTIADAREIAARARNARTATVIGGGLLGLEAARGLVELGVEVTVVHLVDQLMETQLDPASARLLARRMRGLGVRIEFDRITEEIVGNGRVEGLRFAGGDQIDSDLVVIATGIVPEVELARRAGIEVDRGIVVDDEMRTSAPSVWAVGECAQHRGTVYGILAPLLAQAKVAAATIADDPGAYRGTVPTTTLKVMGVDLFCAGRPYTESDEDDEIVVADGRNDEYRKLVLRDGRLVGAVLLGDLELASALSELARNGDPVPAELIERLTMNPSEREPLVPDEDAFLCTCNGISRRTVRTIARDRNLTTVDEVMAATRAATGCGSCSPEVGRLLAQIEADKAEDLRYARLARRR